MEKTRIFVLYTGGTIGMGPQDPEKNESPLIPQSWEQLQRYMHSIHKEGYFSRIRNIEFEYASFPILLDSSQLDINHWILMAQEIEKRYADFDGFIIIHGTDTMAYTASGLSFIFQNLSKPVVITGSQLPISHSRTDAITNFSNAIHIAGAKSFGLEPINEVTICFNDRLLRGNRSTKASTNVFEGFVSPDYPALAELEESIKVKTRNLLAPTKGEFSINTELNPNVIILTLFPGFKVKHLQKLIDDDEIDGLIIKTYGSGNAPCTTEFLNCLRQAKKQGTIILFTTQCLQGGVKLGKYASSDVFRPIGVISGNDLTTEAALAKMMWVLGQKLPNPEVEKLMQINLRGEVTV
ncbi:MAG: L-asparaginase [Bacteroidia bacterium]|jgi:L-asparaginase